MNGTLGDLLGEDKIEEIKNTFNPNFEPPELDESLLNKDNWVDLKTDYAKQIADVTKRSIAEGFKNGYDKFLITGGYVLVANWIKENNINKHFIGGHCINGTLVRCPMIILTESGLQSEKRKYASIEGCDVDSVTKEQALLMSLPKIHTSTINYFTIKNYAPNPGVQTTIEVYRNDLKNLEIIGSLDWIPEKIKVGKLESGTDTPDEYDPNKYNKTRVKDIEVEPKFNLVQDLKSFKKKNVKVRRNWSTSLKVKGQKVSVIPLFYGRFSIDTKNADDPYWGVVK